MNKILKNLIFSLIVVMCSLFLFACGNSESDDIESVLLNALSSCEVTFTENETKDTVKNNLTLLSANGKVTVTWSSNNQSVIANDGTVTRPAEDTVVTLTVKVSLDGEKLEKSFDIKVLAKEQSNTPGGNDNPSGGNDNPSGGNDNPSGGESSSQEAVLMTLNQVKGISDVANACVKVESATVLASYGYGYLIKDATASMLLIEYSKKDLQAGDLITITKAGVSKYNTSNQLEKATFSKIGTDPNYQLEEAEDFEYSDCSAYAVKDNPEIGAYVKVEGTLSVAQGYYNMIFDEGSTYVVAISSPDESFGLTIKGGKRMIVEGYIIGRSSDNKRANLLMTKIGWEEESQQSEAVDLPISATFKAQTESKGQTVTPTGWVNASAGDGTYASGWSSFRSNGQYVISPLFKAQTSVDVTFKIYLNNKGAIKDTPQTTKIKFIGLNENGVEVGSVLSDDVNNIPTGKDNAIVLSATISGEGICMVKIEMVKEGGGNIGFSDVTISTSNPQ